MTKLTLSLLSTLALCGAATAQVTYEFAPNFIQPPPGKEQIGNSHGEIAVDAAGNFYVSVRDKDAGIQVYGADGKFVKALKLPDSLHGFVIRKDGAEEFIYGAVLNEGRVIKTKLDGTIVLEIPNAAFPADKFETEKDKKLHLTNCDVAPNGDIYVVDGYGQNWIFVFDKDGKYKKVFGGPGEPLKLANTHKIFIDKRFEPARILACDRGNNRILHLDLDGNLIKVFADQNLRRPSSASFHGDLVCVAEIAGRVSVWDKDGKQVAELGVNDTKGQTNTPKVEPKDWQQGTVTSPHGITFDNQGNILETEWNEFGRVLRWNKK
ncbi:MAG: hypothetical protein JWO89_505 [Verrucomicrobiaceae bacterium]|nr:hypothetical protein [Verrucomicrobiaceae bacterium]